MRKHRRISFFRCSYQGQVLATLPLILGIPLSMVLFGDFSGDSLSAAFSRCMDMMSNPKSAILIWALLLGSTIVLFRYLDPIFQFNLDCANEKPVTRKEALHIVKHFNGLHFFTIFVSVIGFTLGEFGSQAFNKDTAFISLARNFMLMNALSKGVLIGVILSFNLENILFGAKRKALSLFPDIKLKKTSLYKKVFLIIGAIVFFFIFQLLSTTANFFSMGARMLPPAGSEGDINFFFKETLQAQQIHGTLGVFLVKIGLYLFYVIELMLQIKGLIQHPIKTIRERLGALTSSDPQNSTTIDIVTNDEFAEVYSEINTLIKRQQHDLECSSVRLEMIVDQAADPIISFDGEGHIIVFNPAAEQFFGYRAAEMMGKTLLDLIEFTPEKNEVCDECTQEKALIDHLYGHQNGIKRFTGIHQSGEKRMFESNVSKSDTDGTLIYTAILRDISQQLMIEDALTGAKNSAESANALKSEFLANMSHELRTPLNAVLGFTQLLSTDKNLTEGQLEKIDIISRSGEHLLSLINDILDISKIEAGKLELHNTVFSLKQFIGDIREMFSLRCKKNGLSLYVEFAGDIPEMVRGDLGKLRQVIINLVGNAVKFTKEGGIGILVGVENGEIKFSVTDSGKGIPSNEIEMIMQPFTQSSVTDNEGGTGLGLAISSRFIQMMGGKLTVQSELGKGSTFTFSLFLPESHEKPAEAESEMVAIAVKKGAEVTALIVDDKELNRLVLKEMLVTAGFITIEVENGKIAVELARDIKPQIIFMDIKMPVMDGYEAMRLIKGNDANKSIRIFALTASAFTNDEEKILASGFDGFLAKPFKRSSLFGLIKEKSGIALEYEKAPAAQSTVVPEFDTLDFAYASNRLGKETIAEIADAVQINDFTGVQAIVETKMLPHKDLSGLAALMKFAAGNFDEDTLTKIISTLQKAFA